MSRNDLFKAFKDGEYGKVKNLLENDTIILKDQDLDYYWYFYYDVSVDYSNRDRIFEELKSRGHKDECEIYFRLSNICKGLFYTIGSQYSQVDAINFFSLALELNPNYPEALFSFGCYAINSKYRIFEGLQYIDKAINLDKKYKLEKESFFLNHTQVYDHFLINCEKKDLELLLVLYHEMDVKESRIEYKIQLFRLSLYLDKIDNSEQLINDIPKCNKNSFNKFQSR
ncbi:MAG: hypothetical protein PF693_12630 [Spirochaetia bacterium]|jgi:hypothetical protein|nr:hypothetical protein [Spirochaetia bacterium]